MGFEAFPASINKADIEHLTHVAEIRKWVGFCSHASLRTTLLDVQFSFLQISQHIFCKQRGMFHFSAISALGMLLRVPKRGFVRFSLQHRLEWCFVGNEIPVRALLFLPVLLDLVDFVCISFLGVAKVEVGVLCFSHLWHSHHGGHGVLYGICWYGQPLLHHSWLISGKPSPFSLCYPSAGEFSNTFYLVIL